MLVKEDSYTIPGYKTLQPMKTKEEDLVRIICLVKENLSTKIKLRIDLMTTDFPSIWLEFK